MPPIRPFMNAGAVWAYSLGNLADVRARHTVTGAPTIVNSPLGYAMGFDGTNDYVTLVAQEYPLRFDSGTQDFSICMWVRSDLPGQNDFFLDKRNGANIGWIVYINLSNQVIANINAIVTTGPVVPDTLWHHIAFVVDRSDNAIVYLDAVPGTPAAIGGEVMATTVAPRVGAGSFGAAGGKVNGDIHSIVIFDRILSPAEVSQLAGVA